MLRMTPRALPGQRSARLRGLLISSSGFPEQYALVPPCV
jgi:hypothetical protein